MTITSKPRVFGIIRKNSFGQWSLAIYLGARNPWNLEEAFYLNSWDEAMSIFTNYVPRRTA